MNCIDDHSELYVMLMMMLILLNTNTNTNTIISYIDGVLRIRVMVIKKTENTPMYNELFTIRSYDNVEYVERLRNSRMFISLPTVLMGRHEIWNDVCRILFQCPRYWVGIESRSKNEINDLILNI